MKVAMIYMASGFSRRFGEENKLTRFLGGVAMYERGLKSLQEAGEILQARGWESELVVVSQYEEILENAFRFGARKQVLNTQAEEGIAASIRLGTEAAKEADLYLYCVADQPNITPQTIANVAWTLGDSDRGMCCVRSGQRRGNPAAFRAKYREELLQLTGDRGGSQLFRRYPQDLFFVEVDERELADIDSPQDLADWNERKEGGTNGEEK